AFRLQGGHDLARTADELVQFEGERRMPLRSAERACRDKERLDDAACSGYAHTRIRVELCSGVAQRAWCRPPRLGYAAHVDAEFQLDPYRERVSPKLLQALPCVPRSCYACSEQGSYGCQVERFVGYTF